MTLKEAHEIQRRELMSLRAQVARFEKQSSGLFPNEGKNLWSVASVIWSRKLKQKTPDMKLPAPTGS